MFEERMPGDPVNPMQAGMAEWREHAEREAHVAIVALLGIQAGSPAAVYERAIGKVQGLLLLVDAPAAAQRVIDSRLQQAEKQARKRVQSQSQEDEP